MNARTSAAGSPSTTTEAAAVVCSAPPQAGTQRHPPHLPMGAHVRESERTALGRQKRPQIRGVTSEPTRVLRRCEATRPFPLLLYARDGGLLQDPGRAAQFAHDEPCSGDCRWWANRLDV